MITVTMSKKTHSDMSVFDVSLRCEIGIFTDQLKFILLNIVSRHDKICRNLRNYFGYNIPKNSFSFSFWVYRSIFGVIVKNGTNIA